MKRAALAEIKKVLMEELAEPVVYLKQLLAPFLQAYDFFTQTVKNIKEAWRLLVSGCVFQICVAFRGESIIVLPAVLHMHVTR